MVVMPSAPFLRGVGGRERGGVRTMAQEADSVIPMDGKFYGKLKPSNSESEKISTCYVMTN
jgi:hypothetical protein